MMKNTERAKKTIAIIQARMGSSRLPGKMLMQLGDKPTIAWVFGRMRRCRAVDEVVLATTVTKADDALASWAAENGLRCFRGSENDVLDRYYQAACWAGAKAGDIIVRITGDCPLIDPAVCEEVIQCLNDTQADYACNIHPPTYPDGLDCEAMRLETLEQAWAEARLDFEREHVTQYILRHPEIFSIQNVANQEDLSALRWTLDEPEDHAFLHAVLQKMDREDFGIADVLEHMRKYPLLQKINASFMRNEGLLKSIEAEK